MTASITKASLTCVDLDNYGYTSDDFALNDVYDWIPVYDTPAAEQLDGAVLVVCPHAEAQDAGST